MSCLRKKKTLALLDEICNIIPVQGKCLFPWLAGCLSYVFKGAHSVPSLPVVAEADLGVIV